MYKDMVHHPNRSKYDLSSLKCGIMGGSPCPPELVKMVHEELGIKEFCVGIHQAVDQPFRQVRTDGFSSDTSRTFSVRMCSTTC